MSSGYAQNQQMSILSIILAVISAGRDLYLQNLVKLLYNRYFTLIYKWR